MGPAFAAANIAGVVFIAYELHRLQSQREHEANITAQAAREASEKHASYDRAIALHQYFLSPDFYSKVRGPTFQANLTWMHLSGDRGRAYRDAVVQGWVVDAGGNRLLLYVPAPPISPVASVAYHFQRPTGLPSLTEHQALTAMLRFWTRTWILVDLKMIDRSLFRALFSE